MNRQQMLFCVALTAIVLLVLNACTPEQQVALGEPRAWIDVPRDRSVISLKPHEVIAHASDGAGLRLMELIVNGASIGAMNCENLAQPLVTCRALWTPLVPGDYRLEARAMNPSGAVGTSAPVFVSVGTIQSPTPTPITPAAGRITVTSTPTSTPTATPTNTPTSTPTGRPTLTPTNTATFTPSPSPTPTPTQTSPAPSPCPGAPVISSFTASPNSITPGQSATLSWGAVANATSVEIDHGVGGVATPGARAVSPDTTTTYTLTARGCGGTITRQVTITVNPLPTATRTRTPTRTPTLAPPVAPSNVRQVSRSCTTPDRITIAWNDNSNNESGFRIYHRARNPDTFWALVATVGANMTQYSDAHSFSKFRTIEYQVEAFNDAGSSSRATLSVGECID